MNYGRSIVENGTEKVSSLFVEYRASWPKVVMLLYVIFQPNHYLIFRVSYQFCISLKFLLQLHINRFSLSKLNILRGEGIVQFVVLCLVAQRLLTPRTILRIEFEKNKMYFDLTPTFGVQTYLIDCSDNMDIEQVLKFYRRQ